MRKSLVVAVVGLFVTVATAEPLKIIGFETGSGITFEGATVSNYFTIEFATSPSGPWTNWGSITEAPVTGAVMAVPSPFLYRIRQTDSSAFPPYAPVSHTHQEMAGSHMEIFETNGTFIVPAGVSSIIVEVWGGGGGSSAGETNGWSEGSGGGGGGYGKQGVVVTPGAAYAVAVGAGGVGGVGGAGGAGGNSTFGSLFSASGGGGAEASRYDAEVRSWYAGNPGTGGTSTATIHIRGDSGTRGGPGGYGGAAPLGGQGGGYRQPGEVPGGGGSNASSYNGYDGARGRVIVYY